MAPIEISNFCPTYSLAHRHMIDKDNEMNNLSSFQITQKWPAKNPDVIQLYSLPTPNGIKASAMLEEVGLDYEAHRVDFAKNDQLSPEFISLNPNNKIPALIDPNGPDGVPLGLWESGAILIYLAEKTGKLLSADPVKRIQTIQWLMFQIGGVGPMFGQLGFFHKFAGKEIEDKRPFERYRDESMRLLKVLDRQLAKGDYLVGNEYSIADLATWPWLKVITGFYEAGELLGINDFKNVQAWTALCADRPASQKAINIPAQD